MMTLRAKIFTIASLVVLILTAIVLLLIWRSSRSSAPVAAPTNLVGVTSTNFVRPPPIQTLASPGLVAPLSSEDAQRNAAKQLARVFLERHGSYSSVGNYENIKEVQNLVTSELWKTLSAAIKTANNQAEYVGITTRVVGVEIVDWKADSAAVKASVVRSQESGGQAVTAQAMATVQVVKTNGAWLVDSYAWEK